MIDRIPMTLKGAEQLKESLTELKVKKRPQITAAIAEARAHGDLKENAEYHAAKEEQGFIERRIIDIETKLANSYIVDPSKLNQQGKVVFGVTVLLTNTETLENTSYQIVGEDEADIKTGKLSFNSPIARALIGKQIGDYVEVKTPAGIQAFEIAQVEYL